MTPFTTDDLERFNKKWTPEPNSGCWLWFGALSSNGYGSAYASGNRFFSAHHLSFLLHVGPVPEGLVLDHLCRQRLCVNPQHLEAVTLGENTRRGAMTKLTSDQARAIFVDPRSWKEIGAEYGLPERRVGMIKRGQKWSAVTAGLVPHINPRGHYVKASRSQVAASRR